MTDLPYFAWNRAEAERLQTEIRGSGRASDAEPSQEHEHGRQLPGVQRSIPESHDA